MKYRTFGRLGWNVSEIGFVLGDRRLVGIDSPRRFDRVRRSLDLGCNFLDTAQGYGNGKSERIIAQVLKEHKGEHVYVATKIPPMPQGAWPPTPYDRIEDRYSEGYLRSGSNVRFATCRPTASTSSSSIPGPSPLTATRSPCTRSAKFKKEGKLRGIGISSPEHDQNSLIDLMKAGLLDCVQIIYNIFEQEPQAELLPVAEEYNVGVIVRVVFDEIRPQPQPAHRPASSLTTSATSILPAIGWMMHRQAGGQDQGSKSARRSRTWRRPPSSLGSSPRPSPRSFPASAMSARPR